MVPHIVFDILGDMSDRAICQEHTPSYARSFYRSVTDGHAVYEQLKQEYSEYGMVVMSVHSSTRGCADCDDIITVTVSLWKKNGCKLEEVRL